MLFSGAAARILLGMATGILLARTLGPEARGQLATYVFWPTVFSGLMGFSLHNAATFHAAHTHHAAIKRVARVLQVLSIMLAALSVIPTFFLLRGFYDAGTSLFINCIMLIYTAVELIRPTLLGIDTGAKDFKSLAAYRTLPSIIYLALLLAFVVSGKLDVTWAAFSIVTANLVALLLRLRQGIRKVGVSLDIRRELNLIRHIFQSCLRFYPAHVVEVFKESIDRIILIYFLGNTEVGMYFVAFTFASAPFAAAQQTLVPQWVSRFSTQGASSHYSDMAKFAAASCLISLAIILLMWIILPVAVQILIGDAYAEVPKIATVLMFGMAIRLVASLINSFFKGRRSPSALFVMQIAYLLGFAAAIAVISPSSATSIASCSVVAYAASLLAGLSMLRFPLLARASRKKASAHG